MLIFLEFYKILVGFVNFKFYYELGLWYFLIFDDKFEKVVNEFYGLMKGFVLVVLVIEDIFKIDGGDNDIEMVEEDF